MRYRFRGLLRETGKPVEGHVEAPKVDQAYDLMADNGILCESLREDPRLGDFTSLAQPAAGAAPAPGGGEGAPDEFASAIDSALDTSSTQVNVDDLWRRYRGQRVRVIDRDKIRQRVMSVVTKALQQTMAAGGGNAQVQADKTLERVEEALTKMFGDNQNLTSEVPTNQVAMEDQINRLNRVAVSMEKTMAQMTMMMRRGFGGGGGGADHGTRGAKLKSVKDPKNDKVLLEIFETNLALQRGVKPAAPEAEAASEPAPEPPKPDKPAKKKKSKKK
ncbi:MAG: hypothetical protein AAF333_08150 [Planctomycetota bacterium]